METIQDIINEQNAAAAESIKNQPEAQKTVIEEQKPIAEEKPVVEAKPVIEEQKPIVEEKKEEVKDTFFETLKERYGKEFKSDDEIKSVFEKADSFKEYDEYKTNKSSFDIERQEFEERKKEYEVEKAEIIKLTRPENLFGSEEAYKRFEIIKKQVSEGKNLQAVEIILNTDDKELSSLESVALSIMYNSKYDYIDASAAALMDVGVSFEDKPTEKDIEEAFDNLTYQQKIQLDRKAVESLKTIKDVKNTEVDAKDYWKDFEQRTANEKQKENERRENLTNQWKPEIDSIRQGVETVKKLVEFEDGSKEEFTFSVDKQLLDKVSDIVNEYVVKNNIEKTPENIKKVSDEFLNGYMSKNWEKFFDKSIRDLRSKMLEQNLKDTENPTPFNGAKNPAGKMSNEEIASLQMKQFNLI